MKYIKRILILLLILTVLTGVAFFFYVNDYYQTSQEAKLLIEKNSFRLEKRDNLTIVHAENPSNTGLIFYPGGKVEASAYLPLLLQLADEDITCVLVEMPFNLAVFNTDAAMDIPAVLPDIKTWYLAGHSLGGAMASQLMDKAYDQFEGLILLGAYPVNEAPIKTKVIYGTHDIKLDLDKVKKADTVYEIKGGNHAYFGNYGEQDGDGQASISRSLQQSETVLEILEFIQ